MMSIPPAGSVRNHAAELAIGLIYSQRNGETSQKTNYGDREREPSRTVGGIGC